jgi:ABC-2 type transport system ATP-binding protein
MHSHPIVVKNLYKRYGEKEILRGVNLFLRQKEIIGILGPNGAGKTTLLNIIAGVLKPSSGKVMIMGKDPADPNVRALIGYCPQEHGLIEELSGMDNLLFYASLYGLDSSKAKKRAFQVLDLTGLTDHKDKPVHKYSGGMKKRLSIAISLLNDPPILILDEPTEGLDPLMRKSIWNIVKGMKKEGKSIIIATHYMDEADVLSDRVYIMDNGKIVAEGSPSELKTRYGPPASISIEFYASVVPENTLLEELGIKRASINSNKLRVLSENPREDVPKIVVSLYQKDLQIKSLEVTVPTLEDVFISLTGRRLGE